jgi:hypothetical protein
MDPVGCRVALTSNGMSRDNFFLDCRLPYRVERLYCLGVRRSSGDWSISAIVVLYKIFRGPVALKRSSFVHTVHVPYATGRWKGFRGDIQSPPSQPTLV